MVKRTSQAWSSSTFITLDRISCSNFSVGVSKTLNSFVINLLGNRSCENWAADTRFESISTNASILHLQGTDIYVPGLIPGLDKISGHWPEALIDWSVLLTAAASG